MKTKPHTLINGVAFLAISGIVVKVLGLVFKIPLVHVIGEEGMGYFNSAYTIYNLFFMLSNAGLPVAISILISEQFAKNNARNVGLVFTRIFYTVLVIGFLGGAVLWFFAKDLALLVGNPDAEYCIAVMAPVFLFVCIAGGLRGYFQGLSNLCPTGISQLLEAVCKTVGGIGFAIYGVRSGFSLSVCAALALFGIAVGSFLSMGYLLLLALWKGAFSCGSFNTENESVHTPYVLKRLCMIAFPVTIGSLVVSLSNFLDLTVVMRGLRKAGISIDLANQMYGNYTGLAVPLFNLPPVLIMPIAYAAVPNITNARIHKDLKKIAELTKSSLKAVCVITLPCVFGLFLLSKPVLLLLFEKEAALRAAPLLTLLAPAIFFVGIVTVTSSVLQAYGKPFLPVFSMVCGAGVKLFLSFIAIPYYGIAGAPIGTLCCYMVIAIINLIFCMRLFGLQLGYLKQFWLPLLSALGSTLLGRVLYSWLCYMVSVRIAAFSCVIVIAVVYFVLLIVFRVITQQELAALPIPIAIKRKISCFLPKAERTFINEKCKRTERSGKVRI